jgi:VWFA-related protein
MKTLTLAAVLFVAATAAAQFRENIEVQVIDVPVYVYRGATPVRNLTKDDFELYVNGKPRNIDYFDVQEFTPAPLSEHAMEVHDARERRMFLVYFDFSSLRPGGFTRERDAVLSMIDHASPRDYFAITYWKSTKGTRFLSTFTNDRAATKAVLMKISAADAFDAFAATRMPQGRDASSVLPRLSIAPNRRLIEDQLDGLAEIADQMSALEGYRHVLLFSEGLNERSLIDPGVGGLYLDAVEAFRSAGVIVDAIDPSVVVSRTPSGAILESLALETGGQYIHWQNDLHVAVNQIAGVTGSVYRLGFKALDPKDGDNTIEVKLRNAPRGTQLSYRRGFSTTHDALTPGYDELRLADIVTNDIPQSGIPPAVVVNRRDIAVTIPTQTLLASSPGLGVTADLLMYVFDSQGREVDTVRKQFVLTHDDAADVTFHEPLKVGAGKYVVKALLRARKSIGFTKQTVTVE